MLLIMSDIHGNLSALNCVIKDACLNYSISGILILGDLIDYGMRSNEVIECLKEIDIPIMVNIWGNHEKSILEEDYKKFSSPRGVASAQFTAKRLTEDSKRYINTQMNPAGYEKIVINNKKVLAIHGSLEDTFWRSVSNKELSEEYNDYDIVLSGHSHLPQLYEKFYLSNNLSVKSKKKTIFVNPGSVGQPRNLNPNAQYAVLDENDLRIHFNSVPYDIAYERSLYTEEVDCYYKERLSKGV